MSYKRLNILREYRDVVNKQIKEEIDRINGESSLDPEQVNTLIYEICEDIADANDVKDIRVENEVSLYNDITWEEFVDNQYETYGDDDCDYTLLIKLKADLEADRLLKG